MVKGLCRPQAPPFLLAAGANPRKWPCSQPIFHAENASLRFAALLLLLRSRARSARCERNSSPQAPLSVLCARFDTFCAVVGFVAVPVAAPAPALLALVVLLRALLCPAALLAAAAAETSGYAATPFAGRLPLLFPGVLVVQVLLQCFPGLLLRFISLKTRPDNKEQAGAPCAENTKAPSAERGATKK